MHFIDKDFDKGYIEVTVVGFWQEDQFDVFVADLREAIQSFSPTGKRPMTLYNYSDAAIQTRAVVDRMRALAHHPAMIDRKVALYTDGVLARQQAKRIASGRDNMRVFDCRADAMAYLFDDVVGDAPAPAARPAARIAVSG